MGFFSKAKHGKFSKFGGGVKIGKNSLAGTWAVIGKGAVIGRNVTIGDWAKIGAGSVIEDNVKIGSRVKIGDNCHIEEGAILRGHMRVQPGVTISADAVFEGHELVTEDGTIIPNRCCGFAYNEPQRPGEVAEISGAFGQFEVPFENFSREMIDDHMWGKSDALEQFRTRRPFAEVESDPAPEM